MQGVNEANRLMDASGYITSLGDWVSIDVLPQVQRHSLTKPSLLAVCQERISGLLHRDLRRSAYDPKSITHGRRVHDDQLI